MMSKPNRWVFSLPVNKLVSIGDIIDMPYYPPLLVEGIDTAESNMFVVEQV